jgi:hypothetical protein
MAKEIDDVSRAPAGWSPESKLAFNAVLPTAEQWASIKAYVLRREADIEGVDKFVDMAKRGGTTVVKALEAYTALETLLRQDVFAGIDAILANAGIKDVLGFAKVYRERVQRGQRAPQPSPRPVLANQL